MVVNLINKMKKYAGCPFPFRDEQGPVYLGAAVKHVEKDVYFDKDSGTQRVTEEGNRYYHCQVSCITSRHLVWSRQPYFILSACANTFVEDCMSPIPGLNQAFLLKKNGG